MLLVLILLVCSHLSTCDDVLFLGGSCLQTRFKDKCYYIGFSEESWDDAAEYCSENGMSLAAVKSMEEADFLASTLALTGSRFFWIGANDYESEGMWVNVDNSPAFTGYWSTGEPNGEGQEDCGELQIIGSHSGRLNDQKCSKDRRFICERVVDQRCTKGGYMNKCYLFSMHQASFDEAKDHCRGLGMILARASDTGIANFLAGNMRGRCWVDSFVGVPVSSSNYRHMGYGGSAGYGSSGRTCLELALVGRDGRVGKIPCYTQRYFICQSEPSSAGTQTFADSVIDGDTSLDGPDMNVQIVPVPVPMPGRPHMGIPPRPQFVNNRPPQMHAYPPQRPYGGAMMRPGNGALMHANMMPGGGYGGNGGHNHWRKRRSVVESSVERGIPSFIAHRSNGFPSHRAAFETATQQLGDVMGMAQHLRRHFLKLSHSVTQEILPLVRNAVRESSNPLGNSEKEVLRSIAPFVLNITDKMTSFAADLLETVMTPADDESHGKVPHAPFNRKIFNEKVTELKALASLRDEN